MQKLNWKTEPPGDDLIKQNKLVFGVYEENGKYSSGWVFFARDTANAIKNGFHWTWVSADELVADALGKSTMSDDVAKNLLLEIARRDELIIKLQSQLHEVGVELKTIAEKL